MRFLHMVTLFGLQLSSGHAPRMACFAWKPRRASSRPLISCFVTHTFCLLPVFCPSRTEECGGLHLANKGPLMGFCRVSKLVGIRAPLTTRQQVLRRCCCCLCASCTQASLSIDRCMHLSRHGQTAMSRLGPTLCAVWQAVAAGGLHGSKWRAFYYTNFCCCLFHPSPFSLSFLFIASVYVAKSDSRNSARQRK